MSQWADEYRFLSSEASAEPGKWHTDRAPYQREMMDAVNDPRTEMVVIMSSAQVGKTEIINNIIGYNVHLDPSPILLLQPTLEMAEAWSKDRFAPMLRDTYVLKGLVKDPRTRDSGNTLLHKRFPGGHITMAGANSPASLASRPIRLVLCDEVDRYPVSAGTEGDPVSLAKKRTTTFWNRKILLTSTPTIKGASRIESAFEQSDQRRFYVPCPQCGEKQTLKWQQVKWEQGEPKDGDEKHKPETAAYICEHNGCIIGDADKADMLLKGEWIAEAPFNGVVGFHLNELYSPWVTFVQMVAEFLKAKKLPETLKTWVNTSLGETWEESGESVEADVLLQRKESWGKDAPEPVVLVTAGVDVQGDRLEVEVKGWGLGEECWSLDYRVFYGDPAQSMVWQELDAFLLQPIRSKLGVNLNIACVCVDSGASRALKRYADEATNAAKNAEDLFGSAASKVEDTLVDMVTSGEFSFKKLGDLVQSIEQDILRMFIRQQITGPIAGALGDFAKGSGGDIFGSIFGSLFHDGGVVGVSGVSRRAVPAYAFAGAPRFHNGLMPDEFPAILQKGETVLPKNTKMGGNNITFNITTPNAQSFMESQGQIMSKLAAQMGRHKARNG